MSLKRVLMVAAALVLTLPGAALADGVNFGFAGGSLDASGLTLTTISGNGVGSTLNFVGFLPGNSPSWSGNLGTVNLATGNFISNCSTGGLATCYGWAGSSISIVSTAAFGGIPANTPLFTGTFIDVASASFAGGPLPPGPLPTGTGAIFSNVNCAPNTPAGILCFRLYGTISGTLDPALVSALGLGNVTGGTGWIAQIDLLFINNPNLVLSITHGDAQLVVPEPATLALFGTGLVGIAGLLRRKLMS